MMAEPSTSRAESQQRQSAIRSEFDFYDFCVSKLDNIASIQFNELIPAKTACIVAGHGGILTSEPSLCLKPINPLCLRSRREQLFYQMVRYFQTHIRDSKLYYRDFPMFVDPAKPCDCYIDGETFRSIRRFIPTFSKTKHLVADGEDFDNDAMKLKEFNDPLYSTEPWCPCYGIDSRAKNKCSVHYDHLDFICMEDIQAHCEQPCVIDVKMGRITYDPMATERKIKEQIDKYPRLRDFGFRILGMKNGMISRGKEFGKKLNTQEQVFEALESFFEPLGDCFKKCAVMGKMLDILELILEWFETKNNNQLRFYSSSLLFVYDSAHCHRNEPMEVICQHLANSVRVKLIDFAHVFHSHDLPDGPSRTGSSTSIRTSESLNKDDGYLYGLRRLIKFFIMLNRQQRAKRRLLED